MQQQPVSRLTATGAWLDDDRLASLYAPPPHPTPWLRANFVSSIDGAVEVGGFSARLSNPVDQHLIDLLRMQCDALLLGAGTLRREGYGAIRLAGAHRRWRRDRKLAADPTLVVVSGSLDLDPRQPAFADAPVRPIVLTQASAPAARRSALAATTEVITVGEESVDLAAAVALLQRRGLCQLLSEGGPRMLGGLTAADLVDELCLTVSPLLAGAGAGRITAGADSPVRDMSLQQVLAADDLLFLRYRRRRAAP